MKQSEDSVNAHANNFSKDWVELSSKEAGTDLAGATRTYVFGHKTVVAPGAETDPLFDKVQLKNFMEEEIALTDKLMSVETLSSIYDTYVNQNK